MTTAPEDTRPEPQGIASEIETLRGFLDFQRATLAWKCAGLSDAAWQQVAPVGSLTLAALVKHLAWVEDYWFTDRLSASEMPEPWRSAPWQEDHDWEMTSSQHDSVAELEKLWQAACSRSDRIIDIAMKHDGLDTVTAKNGQREPVSLRWILVHMIEEYARHNGHADLIRESIDGVTGE